jgi:hypothetical protein
MPNVMDYSPTPVFALEIDRDGHLSKKTMRLGREEQLTNTLLQGFYPGIRVATIDVPTEPAAVRKKENSTLSKPSTRSDWRRGFVSRRRRP